MSAKIPGAIIIQANMEKDSKNKHSIIIVKAILTATLSVVVVLILDLVHSDMFHETKINAKIVGG